MISPIFKHSFYTLRSLKCKKRQSSCRSFFALLGSVCAQAARGTLVKLTPGLNFINVLRTAFTLSGSTSVKAEHKYVGEIDTCTRDAMCGRTGSRFSRRQERCNEQLPCPASGNTLTDRARNSLGK